MRVLAIVLALAGCGGGGGEPDWLASCDCPEGQICRYDGPSGGSGGEEPAFCVDPPEACAAAFEGDCDTSLLDDPCWEALCGSTDGTHAYEAACWAVEGEPVERMADCDAPMTF